MLAAVCTLAHLFLMIHAWGRYLTFVQVRKRRIRQVTHFIFHFVWAQKPCFWLLGENTKHPIFSPQVIFPFLFYIPLFIIFIFSSTWNALPVLWLLTSLFKELRKLMKICFPYFLVRHIACRTKNLIVSPSCRWVWG